MILESNNLLNNYYLTILLRSVHFSCPLFSCLFSAYSLWATRAYNDNYHRHSDIPFILMLMISESQNRNIKKGKE